MKRCNRPSRVFHLATLGFALLPLSIWALSKKIKLHYEGRLQQALEALMHANHKASTIIEAAHDAIAIVNQEGVIKEVNSQLVQWFGYTRDELVGQPIEILVPARFKGMHHEHRQKYMGHPIGRPMSKRPELWAVCKDSREFPVDISLTPTMTKDGLIVTAIIRDITDRKKNEIELKTLAKDLAESNAELEYFATIVSHDLKEPLIAIGSSLQLLKSEVEGTIPPDLLDLVDSAINSSLRASELIDDLLSYSRIIRKEKNFVSFDTNAVLRDVTSNLKSAISGCHAQIEYSNLPPIFGNRIQFVRLFQNLIANAIKFQDQGSVPKVTITATTRPDSGDTIFAVRDNGVGFDMTHSRDIFGMFKRLHKRTFPGTGVGLATCKKIIDYHGGKIWADSAPGRGATFYFSIPNLQNSRPTNCAKSPANLAGTAGQQQALTQ